MEQDSERVRRLVADLNTATSLQALTAALGRARADAACAGPAVLRPSMCSLGFGHLTGFEHSRFAAPLRRTQVPQALATNTCPAALAARRLRSAPPAMSQDSDNAWKDVLDGHFEDFLRFFFPGIHTVIDWSQPVTFLDKEFTRLIPRALRGKALVDKLAMVKLKGGEGAMVHIHVDVQGRPERHFEARIFRYNVRGRERYGCELISLVVLTEDAPGKGPCAYEQLRWGFRVRMEFPTARLCEYRGRERELWVDPNPFSVVVLAHLLRMQDPGWKSLYGSKLRLLRLLLQRGYDRQQVEDFTRFLDWILRLPEVLEDRIIDITQAWEGEKHMPYLTNAERRGLRKGREEGLAEGRQLGQQEGKQEGRQEGKQEGERAGLLEAIALGLELRFGPQALELLSRVRAIQNVERLRGLVAELKTAPALEAFAAAIDRV